MINIFSQNTHCVIKLNKMNFEKLDEYYNRGINCRKNKLLLRPTKSTGELKL